MAKSRFLMGLSGKIDAEAVFQWLDIACANQSQSRDRNRQISSKILIARQRNGEPKRLIAFRIVCLLLWLRKITL